MDNLSANLIEYQDTAKEIKAISAAEANENTTLLQYYKEITDAVSGYDYLMLFGPTNAKTELQTILSHDNRFSETEIVIKITDKLTHNEQLDFINDYFYINS